MHTQQEPIQSYGLGRERNKWLQGYLQHLLDADLIEPSVSSRLLVLLSYLLMLKSVGFENAER
jgi:hypothetical protein